MKSNLLLISLTTLGFQTALQAQTSEVSLPTIAYQMHTEEEQELNKSTFSLGNNIFKAASFSESTSSPNLTTYINQHLHYPQEVAHLGLSGTVRVSFDILPNGNLSNIAIIESPNQAFDTEVIKLLKAMPAWKPALAGTSPIKSKQQLKVDFSLQ